MAQHPVKTSATAIDKGLAQSDYVDAFGNLWVTGTITLGGTPAVTITNVGGNPVVVSGTVATTPPANASTDITRVGGIALALGQKAMQSSLPVAIASDQSAVRVLWEGTRATYSAAINAHAPAATPTDWFTLRSTGARVVRVTSISVQLRATAANQYRVSVAKYATLYTGGTSAGVTMVSHDAADAVATATVLTWAGGLPTVGTLIGHIADDSLPVGVLGTPTFNNEPGAGVLYDFGVRNTKPIVLRTAGEYIALNSGAVALPAGLVADVRVQWTEDVS